MAAITSHIPAFTMEQLIAGHSKPHMCGTNKLALIVPGLYVLAPSTCSLLDYAHHGNLFAINIDEDVIRPTHIPDLFLLDFRIAFAWHWKLSEGQKYLLDIIQYVGPCSSHSFDKATNEIGIAPEFWPQFVGAGMVEHYILPLTQPAPLDDVIRNARLAQQHLRRLYGFAALLRKLTLGRDTILRCPEDSSNWQHHALHCDADIVPLIDVDDDDDSSDYNISLEEAKDLATEQMVLADQLHEDVSTLQGQLDRQKKEVAQLQKQLHAITSERDALQTELGRAKSALSRSLRRIRDAESYISSLQEDDYGNFIQVPLPGNDSSSSTSSTSSVP